MAEPEDEYWTKKELARKVKCSERTIDRLIETGDAPPVTRLSCRRIIFHAPSAREWLVKRTVKHGSIRLQDAEASQAAPQGSSDIGEAAA